MNKLRIGISFMCALVILSGAYALYRRAVSAPSHRAPTASIAFSTMAGTGEMPAYDGWRLATRSIAAPVSEFLPESDTTGLLQESLTIDDLLDEVNADSGPGFSPVDRERFEVMLRSDPELRKTIAE